MLLSLGLFADILPTVRADLDFSNKYNFRGGIMEADTLYVKPIVRLGIMGFHVGGEALVDLTGDDLNQRIEAFAGYTFWDKFGLVLISDLHFYKLAENDSQVDFSVKASFNIMKTLYAYSDHYLSLKEDKGAYYGNVGAKIAIEFLPMIGFAAKADIGFGSEEHINQEDPGLKSFNASAVLVFKPLPLTNVKLHVDFSQAIADYSDILDDDDTSQLFGGVSFGFRF